MIINIKKEKEEEEEEEEGSISEPFLGGREGAGGRSRERERIVKWLPLCHGSHCWKPWRSFRVLRAYL